jgi:Fe-S cluster biogenesis protein NfuA
MFGGEIVKLNSMELKDKVLLALDEIRPFLAADGGDIALVDIVEGKIVKVQLQGACAGCSVNQMTLKSGVEMTIKKHAPEIEEVINLDN